MPTYPTVPLPGVDFNAIAQQAIRRIEIESAWGPKIGINDPFKPGPPNPKLQALQPVVRLYPRGSGVQPVVIAPYGVPEGTKWPLVRDGLILGGIVAAAGLAWLVLK